MEGNRNLQRVIRMIYLTKKKKKKTLWKLSDSHLFWKSLDEVKASL